MFPKLEVDLFLKAVITVLRDLTWEKDIYGSGKTDGELCVNDKSKQPGKLLQS